MPTSDGPGEGLTAGELFAGYTIVRRLGAGGMGQVYLAQHPRLPRRDALKILPAELTSNSEYRQRFNREAELAASLYNQHIVGIHDRGEYQGQLWLSMDYVEGTDAARLLHEHYPNGMPLPEVVQIISAVADALDYAHSRGLLHRDVKPANILLGDAQPRRRIVLADFGIARELGASSNLTATNITMGTTAYCSPEQLQGLDLDGRVDQYALGCTAYQLLTGVAPFDHTSSAVIISQHLSAPPPLLGARRPDLAYLDGVIVRAMAKDPAARFASCTEFAAALGAPPGLVPVPPMAMNPPVPMMPPPPRGGGHATLIVTLAAITLVGIAVILGVFVMTEKPGSRGADASSQTSVTSRPPAPPGSPVPTAAKQVPHLTGQVTDENHVLNKSEHFSVEVALDQLHAQRGTMLYVVYVSNFGGVAPDEWAARIMRSNNFQDHDAILAIATESASFAFQVPPAVSKGAINVDEIRQERIKPAVAQGKWAKAALEATAGLNVGSR